MERGSVSNVPMQPRRLRVPVRGETVFHVTKRGDSTMSLARCEVWRPMPIGVNVSVELAGVVSAVEGLREEDEDEEPGVEEPEGERAERRWRVGLRGLGDLEVMLEVDEGSSSSSATSSSADSSSASNPLGYSAHEVCTWYKLIGVRFSRLADRASKQYRQCSTVAMAY